MKLASILIFLVLYCGINAQPGGKAVYSFLRVSPSSVVSALGGTAITRINGDLSLVAENPALLTQEHSQQLTFQHQFLPAGIQAGYAGYAWKLKREGLAMHAGARYVLYGEFEETDEFGNIIGNFKGNDLAMMAGISYQLYEKMRMGANLKLIQSILDIYQSTGLALDLGLIYQDTASRITAALVIQHAGRQLTTYDQISEKLPLNIQIGLSKSLQYLPFRFYITLHHLNQWNLLYENPFSEEGGFFGGFQPEDKEPTKLDNFFRHFVFGGEMTLGKRKNFFLRLGYNHQIKQELAVPNLRSLHGFSYGFGLKSKKFSFDFASRKLHFGGSSQHLGISTNIRSFISKGIL